MKQLLRIKIFLPAVLTGLLLGALPFLYFPFLCVLTFCTSVFVLICLLDFIRRTDWRKLTGLVLIQMFVIAIVGLLFMGLLWKLQ